MKRKYEIPPEGGGDLEIGKWVEIFEAYGEAVGDQDIKVQSMRVGGKVLVFDQRRGRSRSGNLLRPHEGEVVFIDRGPKTTRFALSLSA